MARTAAVKPWDGVKDAPPSARVPPDGRLDQAPQSEDCLSLNIWGARKARQISRDGVDCTAAGFFGGTGSQDGPNAGNGIVAHGRHPGHHQLSPGVFGFFAHPELSAESSDHSSGNQAVLDQIAGTQMGEG